MSEQIEEKLRHYFSPQFIKLSDFGAEHIQHADNHHGRAYIELKLVSSLFSQKSRLERHKMVYAVLKDELQTAVHAMTMRLYAPEEWPGH